MNEGYGKGERGVTWCDPMSKPTLAQQRSQYPLHWAIGTLEIIPLSNCVTVCTPQMILIHPMHLPEKHSHDHHQAGSTDIIPTLLIFTLSFAWQFLHAFVMEL